MIEIDVREYRYPNGVVGLRDFKEELHGCEFVIGRTGSGKSTLLRILNGAIPNIYSGELVGRVSVFGYTPNCGVAYLIPQNVEEAVTCRTVVDEIAFPLIQRGCRTAEARSIAEDIAEELGIGGLLDRSVFEISSGELQLVEIAAAICSDARLLLLDEPFAHLSRRNAERVVRILKDFPHVVSDHRVEFGDYFERVIDLGLVVEEVDVPCGEPGEVIYDGLIELREGEIIAITGDNGAGKTTLLRSIARDMMRRGLNFSLVLQHPPYHLSARSVAAEAGKYIDDFELRDVASRHPQSLSSGQMKRLSIAKAFRAEILLLDEPTAGQDVNFRRKLIAVLRRHRKAAVIATHDEVVAELCDRVLRL